MRNSLNVAVILECTRQAFANEMTFPQTVAALAKIGIERYSADLTRLEKMHYNAAGDSLADPLPLADAPDIGDSWSADGVIAAVRSIQQGQIDYPEFLRQIMIAGCPLYWVYLSGRKAIYFGRRGEMHIENFPSPR